MLHSLIETKVAHWLETEDCPALLIISYIRKRGWMREAQIEAIQTYLFLKIEGRNRPLWELFAEGFFAPTEDLAKLHISEQTREVLENDVALRALYQFARRPLGDGATALPELEKYLRDHAADVNARAVIKDMFYSVDYADYLFSLPMGAGKTFLMAAFITLDLYFAQTEPDNPIWAHNFLVMAPSGTKSSIVPSLKSIENFDAELVLPQPAASQVKALIQFELLDEAKSGARSNKARNPNAQKISAHQPFADAMGLVMVTNAEKVILDKVKLNDQGQLFEESDDEKEQAANEFRALIGKIPHLQILIDEVHHAATDDVKLRQVVNKWSASGNVNGVLGFSGTPYLDSPEKVEVADGVALKFGQITNTVHYFPLTRAIQEFLKKPTVKPMTKLDSSAIVRRGVADWLETWGDTVYADGNHAKLAIYCGRIERLEDEIFPLLAGEMGIPAEQILKYHRGNTNYPAPTGAELEFASLDNGRSKIRIILLVQIGKEGWDCRSLSGVILSQKGDCPTNMVLQTSCRCLREVTRGDTETAGIWLSEENAATLDKQLAKEQHTSIAEINALKSASESTLRARFDRRDFLRLPPVEFYQLQVTTTTLTVENTVNPSERIGAIDAAQHKSHAQIIERGLETGSETSAQFIESERGARADFGRWLSGICRESFGALARDTLCQFEAQLRPIFAAITYDDKGTRRFNALYDDAEIAARVRLAFHPRRELQIGEEIIHQKAELLVVEKLEAIADGARVYPSKADCEKIKEIDDTRQSVADYQTQEVASLEEARATLEAQKKGMGNMLPSQPDELSAAVQNKDRSFHFAPYKFDSDLERDFLREALKRKELRDRDLELYFNGERALTDFKIECHIKRGPNWARVGEYTPDFLLVERRDGQIYRALIIETKGKGYAEQSEFVARRDWVENEWLQLNNQRFGYQRFQYLFLSDAESMDANMVKLCDVVASFFDD